MNTLPRNLQSQQGFTIVELMVAATLGLLILAGAVSMFVSNKRVYKEQDETSRLQENARFALDMMVRDIRMAGYAGCADEIETVVNHVNGAGSGTSLFNFTPVEGSESGTNWEPSNSTSMVGTMNTDSDGITIRYLSPSNIKVMDPAMTVSSAAIHISVGSNLSKGNIVAISDCESADVVVMTSDPSNAGCGTNTSSSGPGDNCKATFNHNTGNVTGAQPGNAFKDLSKTYGPDAEIMLFVTNRYFIQNEADGNPVLYREVGVDATTGNVVTEALIDGVENMQILYGEDTANNDRVADTYVNASSVSNWDNVVSVRLALLMRTVDEYGTNTDTATYDLLGTTINPVDDRRRRRIFTATVQIRNRTL